MTGNGSVRVNDDEDSNEEGSDEEDDEDDEETDEEEEDEEPALKYERLGGIVSKLLQRDSSSALAYANQRFVSVELSMCHRHLTLVYHSVMTGIRYPWR